MNNTRTFLVSDDLVNVSITYIDFEDESPYYEVAVANAKLVLNDKYAEAYKIYKLGDALDKYNELITKYHDYWEPDTQELTFLLDF